MNHSLIHKILGLALLVGVFCAFLTPSHVLEGSSETRARTSATTTELASTP